MEWRAEEIESEMKDSTTSLSLSPLPHSHTHTHSPIHHQGRMTVKMQDPFVRSFLRRHPSQITDISKLDPDAVHWLYGSKEIVEESVDGGECGVGWSVECGFGWSVLIWLAPCDGYWDMHGTHGSTPHDDISFDNVFPLPM